LSGLGETILFENGGNETPAAIELFNRALQLDPHSPQALFYTGIALLNAGDLEQARARFTSLRDLAPPPAVVDALDKQIAAIDVEIAKLRPDAATAIHLRVELAAPLAGQVPNGASLFVFVRSPQGGPPLAVKRLTATFPQELDLSASDSVLAGHSFGAGQAVQVVARVSAAGTPTASPGDLYGEISAVAGKAGQRILMVDKRSPRKGCVRAGAPFGCHRPFTSSMNLGSSRRDPDRLGFIQLKLTTTPAQASRRCRWPIH
jgi:cytochrome c-type biogenesis protein CcmH